MFFKNGISQLKNQKARTAMIVVGIVFATAFMFANNILSDTAQYGSQKRFEMIYGDIDYTVYRNDGAFDVNYSYTVPDHLIESVKSYPNVVHAASRVIRGNGIFPSDDESDIHYDNVCGINQSNPDEIYLGISLVVDCMTVFGSPNSTRIESLLDTSVVTNPIVISKTISDNYGWNTGDTIKINPINATKAYATPAEMAAVSAGNITAEELETDLMQNKSRWIDFTVTGIVIDASEGLLKPIPHKKNSLHTISAKDNTVYIPMSRSFRYVFNNATSDGVYYFIISVSEGFDASGLASYLNGLEPTIPFAVFDLYEHIGEYAEYFMGIIRLIFILIAAFTLFESSIFVKNMMEVNVKSQIKTIGILKTQGFTDNSISEMFSSQIVFFSAIAIPIGLVVGYFLSNLVDLSFAYVFLSYNYQYTLPVDIDNIVTILSVSLSAGLGFLFPMMYGMYPVGQVKKWSILEILNPTHKDLEYYKIVKKPNERNVRRVLGDRKKILIKMLKQKMIESEKKHQGKKRVFYISKDNPIKEQMAIVKSMKAKTTPGRMAIITGYNEKIARLMSEGYRGTVKFKTISPKILVLALVVIGVSCLALPITAMNMFPEGTLSWTAGDQYYWLAGLIASIGGISLGSWTIVGDFIGHVGSLFTQASGKFLRGLKRYTRQSIYANSRNNKNTMGVLYFGFILLIFFSCVFNSVFVGSTKVTRTELGGDVGIFQPTIHRSQLPLLTSQVDGVQCATTYTFLTMEQWDFNRDEMAQYIVNTVNGFGGRNDDANENLNVVVLGDIEEYLNVNLEDAYFVSDRPKTDGASFMRLLNEPGSTIVDKRLASDIGLSLGSFVSVNINGFPSTFKVVGIARMLPAAPFMTMMDSEASPTSEAFLHRTMVITRQTLASVMSEFTSNIDIVIKNATRDSALENRSISKDFAGYLSGRIDRTTIDSVLGSVAGIEKVSHRFSTFAPTVPTIVAKNITESRIVYKRNETMAVNNSMEVTPRLYVFNSTEEFGMTTEVRVLESHQNLSVYPTTAVDGVGYHNNTVSGIASALDTILDFDTANVYRQSWINNNSYCIVNKYMSVYSENVNDVDYVYENKVGDLFNVTFTDGTDDYHMQFEVVATIDNHLSYFHNNGTEKEGFSFSAKTFNYNCHLNETEMESRNFYEVFDIDANVFLTTFNELKYMQSYITGLPFQLQADKMMNHLYVKVANGHTATGVAEAINAELLNQGIVNITVLDFKNTLIDKISNFGCVAVKKTAGYDDTTLVSNLREWYVSRGYTWKESSVATNSKYTSEAQIGIPLFEAFNMNFITSIMMSALALGVSVYVNLWTRKKELGILKAMAFENKTIRRFAFIESLAISFIGALIGFFAGLSIVTVVFDQINMTILRPLVIEIPWATILGLIAIVFAIQVVTSQIEARYIDKINAAEGMRFD